MTRTKTSNSNLLLSPKLTQPQQTAQTQPLVHTTLKEIMITHHQDHPQGHLHSHCPTTTVTPTASFRSLLCDNRSLGRHSSEEHWGAFCQLITLLFLQRTPV